MSEQAAQEPTMEEILASIRRIISEDDAPPEGQAEAAAPAPEAAPAAEAAPQPQPEPEPESPALMDETPSVQAAEEEVLELTEKFEEPAPVESIGDIDIAPRAEAPVLQSEPEPEPAFVAPTPQFQTGSATSTAGGTTIEDLVRSILEPKIREWADQNLESIMREIVREKLDRVFK